MMARFGTFFLGKKLEREKAIGDGNCAFNSFILGLCQKDVLNWLDRQSPDANHAKFIQAAAKALNVDANWKSVRKELAKEDSNHRRRLQLALQTVIRQMALDKAEQDDEYFQQVEVTFSAVLNRFLHSDTATREDDMFLKNKFIEDKFIALKTRWMELQDALMRHAKKSAKTWWQKNESILVNELKPNSALSPLDKRQLQLFFEKALLRYLRGERPLVADREYLRNETFLENFVKMKEAMDEYLEPAEQILLADAKDWWRKIGFPEFVKVMRRRGEFAGDIELKQLGVEFGVNICNQRPEEPPYYIHIDHGALPLKEKNKKIFSRGQIVELRSRGVINPPAANDDVLRLTMSDEVEIRKSLERIPDYKIVKKFLLQNKNNLRTAIFPHEKVSPECILQLRSRNIIVKRNNHYLFNLFDVEEILIRARAIVGIDRLLAYISKHKVDRPHIVLANVGHEHWDHLRLVTDNVALVRDSIAKWHKEPAENKWEKLIQSAFAKEKETIAQSLQTDVSKRAMFFIEYQLPGQKKVLVSRKDQEALDHAYAFKIQEEELLAFDRSQSGRLKK